MKTDSASSRRLILQLLTPSALLICILLLKPELLFFLFLATLPVVGIYGIIRHARQRNKPRFIVSILVVMVWLLIVLVILPNLGSNRINARQICCASNLKQVGLALKQYSMDNKGYFPDKNGAAGFEILRKEEYLSDCKVYTCPSTTTSLTNDKPLIVTDYEYRCGLKDTEANADLPLAWDKTGNHKEFVNVLFGDGQVLKMTQKELDALRKKYNR